MVPWGCDYMYQNAQMVYNATDQLIETINANTDSWGVRAHYATASEYVDATFGRPSPLSAALISSPLVADQHTRQCLHLTLVFRSCPSGSTFFPYRTGTTSATPEQDWSGYFTSRPTPSGFNPRAQRARLSRIALCTSWLLAPCIATPGTMAASRGSATQGRDLPTPRCDHRHLLLVRRGLHRRPALRRPGCWLARCARRLSAHAHLVN